MALQVYTKPAVRNAWGDTASNTDLVDPGNTFASAGWQLGLKPPRQFFNWVLNVLYQGIRYLCQAGISAWDAADAYSIGSVVRNAADGLLYQSKLNNNTNQPPATSPTAWGPLTAVNPAGGDSSNALATTRFVTNGFVPVGGSFALLSGQVGNGQIPLGGVTQYQGNLAIAFSQLTGKIANSQILVGAVTQFQGSLSIAWTQLTGTKNADQLNGLVAGPAGGFTNNTLARTDGNGFTWSRYFNQSSANNENPANISQVIVTNGTDGFFRKASLAALLAALGATTDADFGASLAANGFQKLPSGLIIQWGLANPNGGTI